jgi:MFS family permease
VKAIHFIILIAIIAAIHFGLILSGVTAPLSANSLDNILFSVLTVAVLAYMGWSLSNLGLKKIAFKGFLAMIVTVLILGIAVLIGPNIGRPVLGIQVSSIEMLLVFFFFNALMSIAVGVFFAVIGALIALKFKPKKKGKRK